MTACLCLELSRQSVLVYIYICIIIYTDKTFTDSLSAMLHTDIMVRVCLPDNPPFSNLRIGFAQGQKCHSSWKTFQLSA